MCPTSGDISAVDWADVPPVDVLCGGFPCQDVSAAGKRAGLKDGTRSGLWSIFADAIDHLRPPIVIIENVRGLLNATAHRDMESTDTVVGNGTGRPVLRAAGAVLGDLADLGYDAQWATLAASAIGAPHRRERVFIVATASQSGGSAERFNTGRTPGAQTGPHPGNGLGDHHREQPDGLDLLPTPTTLDHVEKRTTHAGGNLTLQGALGGINAERLGITDLLPTPAAGNFNDGEDVAGWLARRDAVKECGRDKTHNGVHACWCGERWANDDLDYLFGHGHVNNDGTKR